MTNSMDLKATRFRWIIVLLLFFSTTIVYFDRVILGILAPKLGETFQWSEQQYGYIVFAFQLAYAIGPFLVGYLIDRIGTRRGFSLSVIVWGLASLSHAFAISWVGFALARFGLGIGQAGNFPASIKIISEWFPQKERAFSTGLFNGGSNFGQIIGPLLVPLILLFFFSWQYVFVFSAVLSGLWLIAWSLLFRPPEQSRFVNKAELDYIQSDRIKTDEAGVDTIKVPWRTVMSYRQTWVVAFGKLFADPVWYFYLFWGAKFLYDKYGVELVHLALPLIVIYVVAYLGGIAGGASSSWLLKRGNTANYSRKMTMLGSALLVLPVMTVPFIDSMWVAVSLIAVAAGAHNSWSANIFTIASDLFPRKAVGSVIGFSTTFSSIGAMFTALLIGYALEEAGLQGYVYPFVIFSFGYLIGLFVIHRLSPKLEPVAVES